MRATIYLHPLSNCSQWKELWQLVSGIYYGTSNDQVMDELRKVSKNLLEGVQSGGDNKTASNSVEQPKEKCPEKLQPFVEKLQQYLDLDWSHTWQLFRYYLTNEYRGTAQSLMSHLTTETNMIKLLNDIWDYYSLERMVQLKVLKNILEFCSSDDHPYATEYDTILKEITFPKLRSSYIEQFTQLVKEAPPAKFLSGEFFNCNQKLVAWTERKLRETNEILQILLLIVHHDGIKPMELKTLVDLFKLHSFGRQQQYLDAASNAVHNDLITKITFSEVALFLKCVDFVER